MRWIDKGFPQSVCENESAGSIRIEFARRLACFQRWAMLWCARSRTALNDRPGRWCWSAQRLRVLLNCGYATSLRTSERVGAALGHVETDSDCWLRVTGKGKKLTRMTLPPLAR
ncbi:hypothetical protein [Burkholderia sp. Ax-1719]|uniref:hypothetical protein n=1 Tax=Burkholderia sp. Ax-1719 TaxID=2608334 RepID=UPI0023DA051D|nr:hypothetical protein [Burkholderia sp. Ax-1719]